MILRRGPITSEQLSKFAEVSGVVAKEKILAPGQLPSHYAPDTPLRLINNAEDFFPQRNQRIGLLAWNSSQTSGANKEGFAAVRNLSERGDLREAAANLFRYLRELDALCLDLIVAERPPCEGLGAAIADRLNRASHK
jgi:L-threonylcarbamoyladenylate synthase